MPTAPLRLCQFPRCPTLVASGTLCPAHRVSRPAWHRATPLPVPRLRGRALQRRRARLFATQPLCVLCLAAGRVVRATIRDHIVPLAEGGADVEANTQALCEACNQTKAQAESRRGRAR